MKSTLTFCSWNLVLITLTFVAWKVILGLVAHSVPGIGYDTSSSLLEDFGTSLELTETPSALKYAVTKLLRWDAIYFTQAAVRGYVFEQEWAFSYAFSKMIATVSGGVSRVLRLCKPAKSYSSRRIYPAGSPAGHRCIWGFALKSSTSMLGICALLFEHGIVCEISPCKAGCSVRGPTTHHLASRNVPVFTVHRKPVFLPKFLGISALLTWHESTSWPCNNVTTS